MIAASLGLADTDEDDQFGDLEVFEHYVVDHTVSELKKEDQGECEAYPSS